MPATTTHFISLRVAIAAAVTVLFCWGTSLAIVGWGSGASGVSAGLLVLQK